MNLKKYINFTYIRLIIYAISFYYFYKKYIKKDKKYSAHDENNKFKIGDFVQIRECAPKSKTKTFEVVYSD